MTPQRRGRPIPAAYTDTNTLPIDCPHCGSPAGTWCTKPDGRPSRVPCVARTAAADITPDVIDFTQPRRPHQT